MKNKLNMKLTPKLIISIVVPFVILLSIMQFYVGIKSFENSKSAGIERLDATSREMASQVENYINNSVESVNTLRNTFIALHSSNNPSREDVNRIIGNVLMGNRNYLATWIMFEPNAFDGKDAHFIKSPTYQACNGSYSFTYYKDNNKLASEFGTTDQYNEEYYTVPKNNKANTLLEPYYYSYVGDTANQFLETSVIVPMINNNKFLGVVAVDIELSVLEKIIANEKIFETGFSSIITNKLQIASHPDKSKVTQQLLSDFKSDTTNIANAIRNGKIYSLYAETEDKGEVLRYFYPVNITGTNTPWSVMVEVPVSEVTAEAKNRVMLLLILNIIGLILFIGITVLVARSITKPIIRAADFVNSVSQGDLTQTIEVTQHDEIGTMSQNLQNMANKLRLVVSDIISNAENISLAGTELSSASQQLSEGANEQAASTEEVSSSMEQMVSNINQNADNSKQTEQITRKASVEMLESSNTVSNAIEAMKKIAEKISIISVIAEKTDLLAINAAIEAARAGEHGKGFAVVATEVRKLAERSQVAAKEIDDLSRYTVKTADESGIALQKLIPVIEKTALLVQEITAASMEQNSGANQINDAIMQLNTVTQRNATASEEISSSAEELVNQSDTLKDIVAFFKTGNEENSVTDVKKQDKTFKKFNQNNTFSKDLKHEKSILSGMGNSYSTSPDDAIFEKY